MDIAAGIFKNMKADYKKLSDYGFVEKGSEWVYSAELSVDGFIMNVSISKTASVSAQIIDRELNEPYTLHLVDEAAGGFVGKMRSEYESILTDIAQHCFNNDIFKTDNSKRLIDFVREKYGDELEFLWKRFPDCAVLRRKDSCKWYAAIMSVSRRKLGIDSDETVEIIDLHEKSQTVEKLVDSKRYFPGYHMNKKYWYTVILSDDAVSFDEICKHVEVSYELAK